MDINSIGAQALTPGLQAIYAVKCIKMAQETMQTTGAIIQDTVEISNEAMQKFLSERA